MDRADPTKTRGGDPDGARVPPKTKIEDKEEKLLGDELDDSFPASDPSRRSRSRSARSRPRRSSATGLMFCAARRVTRISQTWRCRTGSILSAN